MKKLGLERPGLNGSCCCCRGRKAAHHGTAGSSQKRLCPLGCVSSGGHGEWGGEGGPYLLPVSFLPLTPSESSVLPWGLQQGLEPETGDSFVPNPLPLNTHWSCPRLPCFPTLPALGRSFLVSPCFPASPMGSPPQTSWSEHPTRRSNHGVRPLKSHRRCPSRAAQANSSGCHPDFPMHGIRNHVVARGCPGRPHRHGEYRLCVELPRPK